MPLDLSNMEEVERYMEYRQDRFQEEQIWNAEVEAFKLGAAIFHSASKLPQKYSKEELEKFDEYARSIGEVK